MKVLFIILILIFAAAVMIAVRYFSSNRDPDNDIKKNNSNRMLSQYKSKK